MHTLNDKRDDSLHRHRCRSAPWLCFISIKEIFFDSL